MRRALAAVAIAVAGCAPLGENMRESPDAQSLAAAERAFAAQSVREDMRRAFLAHFADDGVFVRRGGWVNARDALEHSTAQPIVLDWHPVYTEVAASGDMGLSTGPWTLTRKDDPAAPAAHGQFVSIWRRDAGGPWRVVVDLGVDHPDAALEDVTTRAVAAPPFTAPPGDDVAQAERQFVSDADARGTHEAYAKWSSPQIRVYRQGGPPAIGHEAAEASSPAIVPTVEWHVEKTATARSRDFGYAIGNYTFRSGTAPLGFYLRVWHREADGWRVIATVFNPTVG